MHHIALVCTCSLFKVEYLNHSRLNRAGLGVRYLTRPRPLFVSLFLVSRRRSCSHRLTRGSGTKGTSQILRTQTQGKANRRPPHSYGRPVASAARGAIYLISGLRRTFCGSAAVVGGPGLSSGRLAAAVTVISQCIGGMIETPNQLIGGVF